MSQIVSNPIQVLSNIDRFREEVEKSTDLQNRLAYARAWYAHKDDGGEWRFGPSKFVGYQGLTAKLYIDTAENRDGRRTEAQLQQWFTEVRPNTDLYNELAACLVALLSTFGKAPSTKMRINVLAAAHSAAETGTDNNPNAAIVELMLVVAKNLPPEHLDDLRARLSRQ